MAIWAIFLSIVSGLGAALSSIGNFTLEAMRQVYTVVHNFVQHFLQVAPKPLKIFVFGFMVLFVANVIFGMILGVGFACTSNNQVRKTDMFNGIRLMTERAFKTLDDATIIANSQPYTAQDKMVRVMCSNQTPRPFFYNINILSFPLWLLLFLLGEVIPYVYKWYKISGVIH